MGLFNRFFGKRPGPVSSGPKQQLVTKTIQVAGSQVKITQKAKKGVPVVSGWLGRRPDQVAGDEARRKGGTKDFIDEGEGTRLTGSPFAPSDAEERFLSQDDVSLFLRGEMALHVDSSVIMTMMFFPNGGLHFTPELQLWFGPAVTNYGTNHWAYRITEHMAESLVHAHSKGTWWWSNLRVRGTKRDHQVPAMEIIMSAGMTQSLLGTQGGPKVGILEP